MQPLIPDFKKKADYVKKYVYTLHVFMWAIVFDYKRGASNGNSVSTVDAHYDGPASRQWNNEIGKSIIENLQYNRESILYLL